MATKVPAKSILKQQPNQPKPTISEEQKAKAEKDRRNLGVALYHANKIQNQKNIQAQILSNTETLLDFPKNSCFTPSEASDFIAFIQPFQPSDYDNFIEERKIYGKCGYALCPNAPRSVTLGASAAWKLPGPRAGDYCSSQCLRKSLYVKTQLSEVPAWERESGEQPEIVLHENDRRVVESFEVNAEGGKQQLSANRHDLALERGEIAASLRPNQVMVDRIVEKRDVAYKPSAFGSTSTSSHSAIEGYSPTTTGGREASLQGVDLAESDDNDDDDDEGVSDGKQGEEHGPEPDENDSWRDLYDNISKR